jgi:hypothetical protein
MDARTASRTSCARNNVVSSEVQTPTAKGNPKGRGILNQLGSNGGRVKTVRRPVAQGEVTPEDFNS